MSAIFTSGPFRDAADQSFAIPRRPVRRPVARGGVLCLVVAVGLALCAGAVIAKSRLLVTASSSNLTVVRQPLPVATAAIARPMSADVSAASTATGLFSAAAQSPVANAPLPNATQAPVPRASLRAPGFASRVRYASRHDEDEANSKY
jgi:hypothetical protein